MGSRQTGAAFATPLFGTVGPVGVTSIRLVFSAAMLLVFSRPSWPRDLRMLGVVLAYGTLLAGMNLSFYQALERLPLGITVAIEFLGPLTVALLGSRRWLDLLWVALATTGVVVLSWAGGTTSWVGIAFALTAAACWAGYILLGTHLSRRTGDNSGLALAMTWAALLTVPIALATTSPAVITPQLLLIGVGLALLSSVIPYSLEFRVLRQIPARTFGILMSLEPAIAALTGYLLLTQQLQWPEIAAISCIVIASVGACRAPRIAPLNP